MAISFDGFWINFLLFSGSVFLLSVGNALSNALAAMADQD